MTNRWGGPRLAERERKSTPPFGGVFVARTQVLDADDVRRAVWRMAHEVIEHNHGLDDVVVVGLQTGGVAFAEALAEALGKIDGEAPAARHARRRLPPRRHRPAAGAAGGGHRHPGRPHRPGGGAGRRRPVHGAHDPGRARRRAHLRPAPGGAAGGDGRPGPPRAADPPRLRGQEPADPARRGGRTPPSTVSSWARC